MRIWTRVDVLRSMESMMQSTLNNWRDHFQSSGYQIKTRKRYNDSCRPFSTWATSRSAETWGTTPHLSTMSMVRTQIFLSSFLIKQAARFSECTVLDEKTWEETSKFKDFLNGKLQISRFLRQISPNVQRKLLLAHLSIVMRVVAELLCVNSTLLESSLCTRNMAARARSVYTIPLKMAEAQSTRDALAKTIYAKLFDWLIKKINTTLTPSNQDRFIGILDIFGFESFQVRRYHVINWL